MADRGDNHEDDKQETEPEERDHNFNEIDEDILEEDDSYKEEFTEPIPLAVGSLTHSPASSPSSNKQTIEHRGTDRQIAGEGASLAASESFTKSGDGVQKDPDSEDSVDNKKLIQSEKVTKTFCAASNIQTSLDIPQAESRLLIKQPPNSDSYTAKKSIHSQQLITEGSHLTKITVRRGSDFQPDRSDFAKHSELHESPKNDIHFPQKDEHTSHKTQISKEMGGEDCQPAGQPSQTVDAVHCHSSRHRLNQSAARKRFHPQPASLQCLTLHPPLQDSAQGGNAEKSWDEFQGYRCVRHVIQILSSHQLCRHAQPLSRFVTDGISGDEYLEYRYTVQQRQTLTFLGLDQSTGLIIVMTEIIRRSDYGEHSHAIAIRIIPIAIQMHHRALVQNMLTGTMRGGEGEQYGGVIRQTFASPQLGSNSQLQHLAIISEDEPQEYPGAVVATTTHSTEPRAEAFETASCSHMFEGSAETETPLSTNTQVGINSSEDGQRQLSGPFDGLPPADSSSDEAFTTNANPNSSSRTAVNGPSCLRYTADCQPAGQPSQTVDAAHCHPSRHRLNQSAARSRFHPQPASLQCLTLHHALQDSAQGGNAEMSSWNEFQGYRCVRYIIQILSSHQLCRHAQPLSRFVTDGISGDEFLEYRYTVQQRQTMTFLGLDQSTGLIIVMTEIIRRSDYGEHSHAIAIRIIPIAIQMCHRARVQNMLTDTMRGGEGEQYGGVIRQTFASPQLGSNSHLQPLAIISEDEPQEYPGAVVATTTHSTDPRAEAFETASCSHMFEGSAGTETPLSTTTNTQVGINSSEHGQRQLSGPLDGLLSSDSTTDEAFTANTISDSSSRTTVNGLNCLRYTADCQPAGQPSQTVDAAHCHPSRHRLNQSAARSRFHPQPASLQCLTLHHALQDSAQRGNAEMSSWNEFQGYRCVRHVIQILSSHQLCRHAQPLSRFVTDGISGDEFLEYRCTVQLRQTMTFLGLDQSTGLIIVMNEVICRSDYGEHSHAIAIRIISTAIRMRHRARVQNMLTGTMRGGEGEQYGGVIRQTFASPQLGSNSQLRLRHLVTISDDDGTQEYPGAVDLYNQRVDMLDDRDMADGEPQEINAADEVDILDFENFLPPDLADNAPQQNPVQNVAGGRQFLEGFVLWLSASLTQRDGRDRRVCFVPGCGRAHPCLFLFNCHHTVCVDCYQDTNPRCPFCRQRVGWFFPLQDPEQEEVPGGRGDATEAEEAEDMDREDEEEHRGTRE